jgi:hypothetical protein
VHRERLAEAKREFVLVELIDSARPRSCSESGAIRGIIEERSKRHRSRDDISGAVDDEARRPVVDRITCSPAPPGHRRHAGGSRLEKDDAKALLLKTEPSIPTEHRPDVGGASEQRKVGVGDVSEHHDWRAETADQPLQSAIVSTRSSDRDREVGISDPERGRSLDQYVHALSRNETADRDHEASVLGKAETATRLDSFLLGEGMKALRVDTRWNDHHIGHRVGNPLRLS